MHLAGFAEPLVANAGSRFAFYVSTDLPTYQVDIVRLRHGDRNPQGPGFKAVVVPELPEFTRNGQVQPIVSGSYAVADIVPADCSADWTLSLWIWPTLLRKDRQVIVSSGTAEAEWQVGIHQNSLFVCGRGEENTKVFGPALLEREWYHLVLAYDDEARTLNWVVHPGREIGLPSNRSGTVDSGDMRIAGGERLLFSASSTDPALLCNGKIAEPVLIAGAVPSERLVELRAANLPSDLAVVAKWDLALHCEGRTMINPVDSRWNMRLVNRPTRGMTGPNWTGKVDSFTDAPLEYNAIHFHDDDLEDAGWEMSFFVDIPEDLPSGIYAARLKGEAACEFISFFVTPGANAQRAPLAFQVPTFSYLAYGNESLDATLLPPGAFPLACPGSDSDRFAYLARHQLRSTYDHHNDGSGICFASALRPNLTSLAPDHRCRLFNGPHQLSADLHLVDWLTEKGFVFDIVTDHCVHSRGAAALAAYSVVISGSHPEYHSEATLDGIENYLDGGGSYMYLGGNGYYWVVALEPERGMLLEIRRPHGTRAWSGQPGEGRLSLTGEIAGLWALRGRPPQKTFGVGMAAQGFDRGSHYKRTEASFDGPYAVLFEGIDAERFGDIPALVLSHGAAGYEVDRADRALGTPPHAVVLATSGRFSDNYQRVVEEVHATSRFEGGLSCDEVRSDVVIFETGRGGTVFSTGSISWCSTLSWNGYDNDVSRLTANVIDHILAKCPARSG